ncbi:MAG: hypothetical protein II658_04830, partial [Prevotella sp.]|nr:hypothetical protein [Prevotella sp.]
PSLHGRCRRHEMIVASYAAAPLGAANQRSLFAKRGKVNSWLRYGYIKMQAFRFATCFIMSLA